MNFGAIAALALARVLVAPASSETSSCGVCSVAASTRCCTIAASSAVFGISTNFKLCQSPPVLSTQARIASVASVTERGHADVFPLRSAPLLTSSQARSGTVSADFRVSLRSLRRDQDQGNSAHVRAEEGKHARFRDLVASRDDRDGCGRAARSPGPRRRSRPLRGASSRFHRVVDVSHVFISACR